jgi:glycosyltransferase involved in cell wall biosynthesis
MDLICFSHLRWGFVFQRPNHLMSRCARDYRTYFVEEAELGVGDEPGMEIREERDGLFVCTPQFPPNMASGDLASAQRHLLDRLCQEQRIEPDVLWFYTPMALAFAGYLRARAVVYDCMDELSAFDGAPEQLPLLEAELFRRADLVFTGGHALYEAKRARHPHVYPFPSSVDVEHFRKARSTSAQPPDQAALGYPRLGYYGVIDERLDYELIAAVAESRPDWQLVMIGPVVKVDPARLPRAANIHWLGAKTYAELPIYVGGWNVALMPFARNRATRFISPTKTLEYMAADLPIVSTAIDDVVEPYGREGVVAIADQSSFVTALEAALGPRSRQQRAAAEAMLARTSWDRTWSRMKALMDGIQDDEEDVLDKEKANV